MEAIKVSLLVAIKRRNDWQQWRKRSIQILEEHINEGKAYQLLKEEPKEGMIESRHTAELTMKKAMSLQLFFRLMYLRDSSTNNTL